MTSNKERSVYPIIVPINHVMQSYNFYVFEDGNSLTLIDGGMDSDECWEAFTHTMNANGFSVHDLTQIILTHNHNDHIGLVNRICSMKELPVFAHSESIHRLKKDKDFFHMRVDFFDQLYQEMGCGDDGKNQIENLKKSLKNNNNYIETDITPLSNYNQNEGLQIIETPGHSSDHVVFYDAQKRRLFGGDFIVQHTSCAAIVEPDKEGNRILSTVQYIESLRRYQKLDVEVVYPGHGQLIFDYQGIMINRLNRFLSKSQEILELIQKGLTTANEIARTYYQKRYQQMFSIVMSEIIGQLDYLSMEKKVQREIKHGVWHYYPI